MYCLRKVFAEANIGRVKSFENVVHQRNYRHRPEKSNLIKVSVTGSGSLGEPASLLVKTCDSFMYVILFIYITIQIHL